MRASSTCKNIVGEALPPEFQHLWQRIRVDHMGACHWRVDEKTVVKKRRIQEHFLLFLKKGRLRLRHEGEEALLEGGDLAWIPPGREHQAECVDGEVRFFSIHMAIRSGFEEVRGGLLDAWHLPLRPIRFWREMFENLTYATNADIAGWRQMANSVLRMLLTHGLRNGRTLTWQSSTMDSRIQRALHMIRHRNHEPLTVSEVAARVGLSVQRFRALFGQETGTTFRTALMNRRLTRARRWLLRSERPIKEIAAMTGFSTARYFHTCFKKHFGCTPAEMRVQQG